MADPLTPSLRFQLRRDSKANWEALNPVLADGEPGFDETDGLLKVGNGQDAWLDLPSYMEQATDALMALLAGDSTSSFRQAMDTVYPPQSAVVPINDDNVYVFQPPGNWGVLRVASANVGVVADVHFRTSDDSAGAYIAALATLGSSTRLGVAGTTLTGVTGTDGFVTIAPDSNGNLQIENRRGFQIRITWVTVPVGT